MHGRAYKEYYFRPCNTSVFNAMRFGENRFTCQREKEDEKGLRVLKVAPLSVGRFQVTAWQ